MIKGMRWMSRVCNMNVDNWSRHTHRSNLKHSQSDDRKARVGWRRRRAHAFANGLQTEVINGSIALRYLFFWTMRIATRTPPRIDNRQCMVRLPTLNRQEVHMWVFVLLAIWLEIKLTKMYFSNFFSLQFFVAVHCELVPTVTGCKHVYTHASTETTI